ncbi:MAG TPA: nuclear transport factor 2 family protein [Thermoleophilaceae bacterium]|jgi:ketosteroid isomerase-like protein
MTQESLAIARNTVAAFNRRDVQGLVDLTTDDFKWVTWTSTVEFTTYHGPDGLARYFRDADVWEVLRLDVEEYRDMGDRVMVAGSFHLRGGGSGAEIVTPYFAAFFMREGMLARVLTFRRQEEALEALQVGY